MEKLTPIQKSPFCCYVAKTIPLAFDESLSYFECVSRFKAYLQDIVIPAVNEDKEAINEIQILVAELQEYVSNYFDNLDVQEEINNKLDAMVEDGTLQEIITDYLNSKAIFCFDTVADMQASTNLINGSYAKTLGYYAINDGGAGLYIITNTTSNLYHQETIGSTLYANLIVENETINFKQLGAKSNDDTYDNHPHFAEYESLCNTNNTKYKLYIPAGVWYSSETQFTRVGGLQLIGNNKSIISKGNGKDNTILRNFNSSQDYYFKIGNNSNSTTIPFENLVSGYFLDSLTFEGAYNNSALVVVGAEWSKIGSLNFRMITAGHCLNISSSWEWDVDFMEFRAISSHDSAIYFDAVYSIPGVTPNCSAWYFNYLNFESMNCSCIETNKRANFINNEFNVIEYERSFATSGAVSSLPEGVLVDSTFKIYLFKGWFDKTTINTINHNNTNKIYVQDGTTWITYLALFTDDIISVLHEDSTYNNYHISVSNILLAGQGASYIVSSHFAERTSSLKISSVCQRDMGELIYHGDGVSGLALHIDSINNSTTLTRQYALNSLMDKIVTNTKSNTTAFKQFELMETPNALDISGCCLISRYSSSVPCNGVKKIHLTVSLLGVESNESVSGNMRFGYKNRADNSYTYITNIALTSGLNRITIDLSEVNYPDQYVIYANSSSIHKLAVYTINYEY